MKLIVATIFAVLAVSAFAEELVTVEPEWVEIDWSKVRRIEDTEGFWDGRVLRPAQWPSEEVRSGRIVGGTVAPVGAHPYQAGLLMSGGSLCGGSLISTTRALTAAHCPWNTASTQVVMGAHTLQNAAEASQQRRTVPSANYRHHPNYNTQNLNNDISVLIMATAVTINARVQISNLALASAGTFAGVTGQMTGWGRMTNTGGVSPTLRVVTNPIITNAVCAQTYGTTTIVASTICTSTAGGRGTCNGDSGGPLTVAQGGGRLQVGVTSFVAAAGCQNGFPAGFARVSSFRAWIGSHTPGL